jgi:histidinol-phosphatase (PHP family)
MKKLFNLHTHTKFSDGSDAPVKYLEEAIRQGLHTLGFSDHSPVPFTNNFAIEDTKEALESYINTISALKRITLEELDPRPLRLQGEGVQGIRSGRGTDHLPEILLGLEADYIPGITTPVSLYREKYPFDYFIGSVHLVKNTETNKLWFIDGPNIEIYDDGLKTIFGGDTKLAVTTYYRQIMEMVEIEKPDIVGHMDKIRMYNRNRYFREDENWYEGLIDETLDVIRNCGCVVEVNTRGLYKKRSDSLFPGPAILKKIRSLGIPVTLSSDAHKPPELMVFFEETRLLLKEIGFNSLHLKTGTGWKETEL